MTSSKSSNRKASPRYARLDGKPPAKPRGRHASKRASTSRKVTAIPVQQRLGFRVEEFAALLGVSHVTIWRRIKRGEIEVFRQGRTTIIPRAYAVRVGLITE